jgi:D-alanyl-D-alanine carboxypeptidase
MLSRTAVIPLLAIGCGSTTPTAKPPTPTTGTAATAPKLAAHDALEPVADRIVDSLITDGDAAAVTIGIARKTGEMFVKSYGLADLPHKVPANRDTVYRIGSLTKQFTAAAILQLAEAGKLTLDDDVLLYAKLNTGGRIVTIRSLLTDTSGVPSYTDTADFVQWARSPHTPEDIVDHGTKLLWEFEPGTHFHESDTGYVLLGMVIEKVSGQHYADYLRDHVFAPAHMTNTRYCDDVKSPERAFGYTEKDDALVDADPLDLSTPFSARGLCSTVPDLLAWTQALAAGKVIGPASVALMTAPVAAAGNHFAMATVIDDLGKHRELWHGGSLFGFESQLLRFPDDGLTIAVLANTETDVAVQVGHELAVAALGIAAPSLVPSAAELAAIAGTYEFPVGRTVVAVDRLHLTLKLANAPAARLSFYGGDTFVLPQARPVTLTFHHDPAGNRITSVTVEQGNQRFDAMRVDTGG